MKTFKILLIVLFLSLPIGCGSNNESVINLEGGKKVKIGVVISLTGENADIGQMVKKGIELAIEEINKVGGVDSSKVELVFFDDLSDPNEAYKGAEIFFKEGDIPVIIGSISNECTISLASVTSRVRMPIISPTASGIGVTGIGPYVFRNSLTDYIQAKSMAEYAFIVGKIRNFAVIYPKTEQGINLNKVFTQRIQELGGRIIANESYDPPMIDFSILLSKLKVLEPQSIYFPGKSDDIVLITRQSAQGGLNTIFLGTDDWGNDDVIKFGGEYVNGAIYTASFYKKSNDGLVANFVRRFKEKFKMEPNGFAAHGYDAARIVVQAMFAGGKNREGIKNGLLKIRNFPGVTGRISLNPGGDAEKEVVILTIKDGKILQLQ